MKPNPSYSGHTRCKKCNQIHWLHGQCPIAGPPLDCSQEELRNFILSMKGGERVVEMGQSMLKGETGTVEVRDGNICIKWDTKFEEGSGLVTSFTGGARLLTN